MSRHDQTRLGFSVVCGGLEWLRSRLSQCSRSRTRASADRSAAPAAGRAAQSGGRHRCQCRNTARGHGRRDRYRHRRSHERARGGHRRVSDHRRPRQRERAGPATHRREGALCLRQSRRQQSPHRERQQTRLPAGRVQSRQPARLVRRSGRSPRRRVDRQCPARSVATRRDQRNGRRRAGGADRGCQCPRARTGVDRWTASPRGGTRDPHRRSRRLPRRGPGAGPLHGPGSVDPVIAAVELVSSCRRRPERATRADAGAGRTRDWCFETSRRRHPSPGTSRPSRIRRRTFRAARRPVRRSPSLCSSARSGRTWTLPSTQYRCGTSAAMSRDQQRRGRG